MSKVAKIKKKTLHERVRGNFWRVVFYNSTTCSSSVVTLSAIQPQGVDLAHTWWDKEPLYNAARVFTYVTFIPVCVVLTYGSTRAALLETAAAFLRWNFAFPVARKSCGCCVVKADKYRKRLPQLPAQVTSLARDQVLLNRVEEKPCLVPRWWHLCIYSNIGVQKKGNCIESKSKKGKKQDVYIIWTVIILQLMYIILTYLCFIALFLYCCERYLVKKMIFIECSMCVCRCVFMFFRAYVPSICMYVCMYVAILCMYVGMYVAGVCVCICM